MNILIVSATLAEIQPLMDELSFGPFNNYRSGKVDILITGVGMIHTTYQLGRRLMEQRYDLVINAGIAGAFDRTIPLAEVVKVSCDLFSEMGAEDGEDFLSMIRLGLQQHDEFPYKWGELVCDSFPEISSVQSLPAVRAITVNTVHGNTDSILKVQMRLNPQIETMEGAACLFVCQSENIPVIQIRSISNYVERRNRDNWQIRAALISLNERLKMIIEELIPQQN